MIQFATTCVDNFFKHPDEIVNLANTLDYKPEPKGMWPGKRSPELHLVAPAFKNIVCTKYLKLHLADKMIGSRCDAYFQKIDAKSGYGWVHNDTPLLHTTLIYLNKDSNLNSGTSIYRPRKEAGLLLDSRHAMKKRAFILGEITAEEVEKFRAESSSDFEETIRFANVYNRCIGLDSVEWHAANEFSQNNDKEPRLTLIIFWYEVSSGQTGLQRSEMEVI